MARELPCSLCSRTFSCKQGIGYWCGTVEVSKERVQIMKVETDDGVCPDCLRGGQVRSGV